MSSPTPQPYPYLYDEQHPKGFGWQSLEYRRKYITSKILKGEFEIWMRSYLISWCPIEIEEKLNQIGLVGSDLFNVSEITKGFIQRYE